MYEQPKENNLKPETTPNNPPSLRKVLGLIWPIYHKHRFRLLLGLVALLGVDFLQLTIPRILKKGIDALSQGTAVQNDLLQFGLLICLIGLLATILRFCWRYLIIGFSRHLERDLRKKIFNHVIRMDGSFFSKYTTGSIMAHGSNDLAAVQMACGMGLVAAVDALVMSVAAIAFMFQINAGLTLLALLPMPILALTTRILSGRMHHRFDRVQEQFSQMTEFARSSIASIRLLKAYTLEESQTKGFAKLGRNYVHSSIQVARIQGLLFPISSLVGSCAMLLVLYFGGRLVMLETISMGDFVAFITYLYMLIWPMMAVGWVANLSQRGVTSLRRVYLLLAEKSHLPPGISDRQPKDPSFRLHDLSFSYPGSDREILHSINLEITPGILGITGPTGCGKTTLCQILARIYPVKNNTLFIGKTDVNELSPEAVQTLISYVSQEALLFSSSLRDNIAFGNPDAGMDLVEKAARAAAIHDEIINLPKGYDSTIGEKGVTLSGGQRGRVALARALLCDRPIIIIDDGLAAVDTGTEQEIINNITPWLTGKTVLWVSQRVKQLAQTDRLLVLDQGQVSDLGSYDELAVRNPFLKEISQRQHLPGEQSNA
ncbi:MAG: ABC transporter ATP-binding protein [Thermodesulfobacteriota bacterium]|nr:ABC transporter ATP-binding protein [Thermodesulfobacteriota bacterium]